MNTFEQKDTLENRLKITDFKKKIDTNPHYSWPDAPPNGFHNLESVYSLELPWLFLESPIVVPHQEMLREALALSDFFVSHRGDAWGWKGLCLYGISHAHTQLLSDYDIEDTAENRQRYCSFTDVCKKLCPVTYQFLKSLDYDQFSRVRFMLLEPGGYILPHKDQSRYLFGSLNIALSHPESCHFLVNPCGEIPLKKGDMFLFANGYEHAVINNSNEPRIHLLIHGKRNESWAPRICRDAVKQLTITPQSPHSSLKPDTDKNTFCAQPWVGLQIRPDKKIRPCCMFSENIGSFDDDASLITAFNSNAMQSVRNKMLSNTWSEHCLPCKVEEKTTGTGPRIFSPGLITSLKEHETNLTFNKIELFISNLCNLDCVMCSPVFSSKWNSFIDELNTKNINYTSTKKTPTQTLNSKNIDSLFARAKNAQEVLLLGGEPFASQEALRFITKWTESECTGQLTIISNGTLLSDDLLKCLAKCKNLLLILSIDGIGPTFEWIRGHSWTRVENKILRATNILPNVVLSPTISLYNIFHLEELSEFCQKNNLRIKYGHVLNNPDFLKIQLLDKEKRENLAQKYSLLYGEEVERLHKALLSNENINLQKKREQFKNWSLFFNQKRQKNILELYPELMWPQHHTSVQKALE